MTIDGKIIAEELVADLQPKIAALPEKKFFGAVLVGEDPASINFLKQKEKVAQKLGIDFRLYKLVHDITTDDLQQEIGRLAGVKNCGGFIVQLPLPESINRQYVLNAIPKEKDVDLLSESAIGSFYTDRGPIVPPSVATVEEILERESRTAHELAVAVIGKGLLIGKPISFWFQNHAAKLTTFDSKTENLHEKLDEADIIVSGVGKPHLFSAKHLKKAALVIDFGYGRTPVGKIAGDFDPEGAEEKEISYTKTPGGTGPILVVELFSNFWKLNKK